MNRKELNRVDAVSPVVNLLHYGVACVAFGLLAVVAPVWADRIAFPEFAFLRGYELSDFERLFIRVAGVLLSLVGVLLVGAGLAVT